MIVSQGTETFGLSWKALHLSFIYILHVMNKFATAARNSID